MGAHRRLPGLGARSLNLTSLLALAAAGVSPWSAPAALSPCPAGPSAPSGPAARVVFPSDSPSQATGPGAIVWSASASCPGGAGARVARIGADEVPGESTIPRDADGRPLVPQGALVASGAPHGQIAIAGASPLAPADGLVIQGGASGPFSALAPAEGSAPPMALTSAYLGDLALAAPPAPGGSATAGLRVHVERFFARRFAPDALASRGGSGTVQTLALAMDYRSEALLAWAQGGAVYARLLSAHGASHRVQRLAAVAGSRPTITALLSDDLRGMVAWADQRGSETSVYIDRSATGVRFGAPELLERFQDPDGLPSPAASPTLVRLSSESVMLAWAGSAAGHWVVRTAPVNLNGVGEVDTIAAPGADALLAALTPGPGDDALLLWTEPQPDSAGAPDMARQALFAARGTASYPPAHTVFGEPELVAPPGPISGATAAFDPDSDRPIAVWEGQAGALEYSLHA